MHIAILGFGREGKSVLAFLKKSPEYRGAKIEILDQKFRKDYLKNLERFEVIFRSPGIPWNLPELKKARRRGVIFSSATKIFFSEAARRGATVIGVTGTKGKGTTATLLYKMLNASGEEAHLAGNIGTPALEILPKIRRRKPVVLELSSFQLQDLTRSPRIAVVLDVFPDHQDSHKNLREYYSAKANIAKYQRPVDKIFFFPENTKSAWIASKSRAKKIPIRPSSFHLFRPENLAIPGYHNFRNAVMAARLAETLHVPKRIIRMTAMHFKGLEHRLEHVRTIRFGTRSIAWYNDSVSTNPETAAAAIRAFPSQPKILIAGGKDKNLDYAPLARALKKLKKEIPLVILFGENKNKILKAIRNSGVPMRSVNNLNAAVRTAWRFASSLKAKSYNLKAVVIFSPGAASFDIFKNYADRGRQFKKLVKKLPLR